MGNIIPLQSGENFILNYVPLMGVPPYLRGRLLAKNAGKFVSVCEIRFTQQKDSQNSRFSITPTRYLTPETRKRDWQKGKYTATLGKKAEGTTREGTRAGRAEEKGHGQKSNEKEGTRTGRSEWKEQGQGRLKTKELGQARPE